MADTYRTHGDRSEEAPTGESGGGGGVIENRDWAADIFETLHEPFLVLKSDLRVNSANEAFYSHFRVREEETTGRLIWELGNGQWDIPALRHLLEDVLPENKVFNDYEVAHDFESIGRRIMLVNGRQLDSVQLILLGIRDITELRAAARKIRESEERFRAFVNASSDAVYRVSADWGEMRQLDGRGFLANTERPTESWQDVYLDPTERPAIEAAIAEAIRDKKPFEMEHRVRRADGSTGWTLSRAVPMFDEEGNVAEWFGTATDVTPRREAQEEARQVRERLTRDLEDMRRLQEVSSLLLEGEGEEGLYGKLLDTAMVIMDADFGGMQRLDERTQALDLIAWRNLHPESAQALKTVTGETGTSCGMALRRGERILVPDAQEDDQVVSAKAREEYRRSGIVGVQSTPLITREGRLVGMISTHWRRRHTPGERELGLLDILARQAADFFERNRTRMELRASEERERFLSGISKELGELTDIPGGMERLGERIARHFEVAWCMFAEIVDEKAQTVEAYGWRGEGVPSLEGRYDMRDFFCEQELVSYAEGSPIMVSDTHSDDEGGPARCGVMGVRAFLIVPLVRDGSWRFLLSLIDTKPREWGEEEVTLLRETGGRLWTRIERIRAEETVRAGEERERFLSEISKVLSTLDDIGSTMDRLGELIAGHFDVDWCMFAELVDESSEQVSAYGWHAEHVPSITGAYSLHDYFSPEELIAHRSGKTTVVDDIQSDVRVNTVNYSALGVRSFIVVPLMREGGWRFLITIISTAPREWHEEEIALLQETAGRIWARLERARAEEALRASEERLRKMVNIPVIGVIRFRDDGILLDANDAFLAMTGYSREEVQSGEVSWHTYTPDEYVATSEREMARLAASGTIGPYEKEYVSKDGARSWMIFVGAALGDGMNVKYCIDIGARKRTEAALSESETRYSTLFESIDEGFCVIEVLFDDNGSPWDYRFLETNPAFEIHTGLSDVAGKRVREIHPAHEQYWFDIYGRIARTGRAERFTEEARELGRIYSVYAFRVGEAGEGKVAVLFDDVTSHKMAEAALRESEARFRAVADLVPDLLWRSDPGGETTWFNRRWMEYTGQPAANPGGVSGSEDLPWDWTDPIHQHDRPRCRAAFADAVEKGEVFRQEARIRRHDGEHRWFLMRAEPIRESDGGSIRHWFGAATDIHEQHAAQELLEQRVEQRTSEVRMLASQLTMAEQEERRRISQVLHDDLQQLLYAVELKISRIGRGLEKTGQGEQACYLAEAQRWINKAIATTRELTVDLSPPILQEEGLAHALEWLVHQMSELHGLRVSLVAEHAYFIEDENLRVLLFQIVRELLFNVKKHAGTDRAEIRISPQGDSIVIHVMDHGTGFDEVAADDLRATGGGGFGLFSVRERLRLLGGRLVVRSHPGDGTHVEVHSPPSVGRTQPLSSLLT